jgi:hypothetical protein
MGKVVAPAMTGRPSDRPFEEFGRDEARLSTYVVPAQDQRGGLPVVEAGVVQGGCGASGAPSPEYDEVWHRASQHSPVLERTRAPTLTAAPVPSPWRAQPEGFPDL